MDVARYWVNVLGVVSKVVMQKWHLSSLPVCLDVSSVDFTDTNMYAWESKMDFILLPPNPRCGADPVPSKVGKSFAVTHPQEQAPVEWSG